METNTGHWTKERAKNEGWATATFSSNRARAWAIDYVDHHLATGLQVMHYIPIPAGS